MRRVNPWEAPGMPLLGSACFWLLAGVLGWFKSLLGGCGPESGTDSSFPGRCLWICVRQRKLSRVNAEQHPGGHS